MLFLVFICQLYVCTILTLNYRRMVLANGNRVMRPKKASNGTNCKRSEAAKKMWVKRRENLGGNSGTPTDGHV